jgi:hypothetical protein
MSDGGWADTGKIRRHPASIIMATQKTDSNAEGYGLGLFMVTFTGMHRCLMIRA